MSSARATLPPLHIETLQQERVWGGHRLGGGGRQPVGESWGAYEGNRILGGPLNGMQLKDACARHGEALLGRAVVDRFGSRFPILTKLLDTSDWLSVQVHPTDELAQRLEGPGHVGKTEAWHLLETAQDAEIILGLQPGVDRARFASAIQSGETLDVVARQQALAGDTWFIPAGTVHALGPGIFLYEIQQASDITYRVYDWDRPASAKRELHLDQAVQSVDPEPGECRITSEPILGRPAQLVSCPYFTLDRLELSPGMEATLNTADATFHALTAVKGSGWLRAGGETVDIDEFETVIMPASAGRYSAGAEAGVTLMIASSGHD